MITQIRLVAKVGKPGLLKIATRYEAMRTIDFSKGASMLEDIHSVGNICTLEDIRDVWCKNCTPVIAPGTSIPSQIPVIEIPDEILENPDKDKFVQFAHMAGFESGEFMKGEVYDTAHEDCFLCRIGTHDGIASRPLWVYNKHVGQEADVILYESEHFFVVSELGSMKLGFLMICPKEHILSMAGMPDEYFEEYYQVQKDVEFILKSTFGFEKPVSFFEHGSDPDGKSSHRRSVVHAHTHVCWNFVLDKKYQDMVSMRPCADIREARGGKYFSYQENASGQLMIVNDPEVYVQRQYPRQVMALQLGLAPGQYNWRKVAFDENIATTLYKMHTFLVENQAKLSERIRDRVAGFIKGYGERDEYPKL